MQSQPSAHCSDLTVKQKHPADACSQTCLKRVPSHAELLLCHTQAKSGPTSKPEDRTKRISRASFSINVSLGACIGTRCRRPVQDVFQWHCKDHVCRWRQRPRTCQRSCYSQHSRLQQVRGFCGMEITISVTNLALYVMHYIENSSQQLYVGGLGAQSSR